MNEPLDPLQLLVAKHYIGGEFAHLKTMQEVERCGDTLFVFCIREAGDMPGPYDLRRALMRATDELRALVDDLEEL